MKKKWIILMLQLIWLIIFVSALLTIPNTSLFNETYNAIEAIIVYMSVASGLSLLAIPFYYDLD